MLVEHLPVRDVQLVPVVAPSLLPPHFDEVGPAALRPLTQCVLRDTATSTSREDHFLLAGANQCTVPDHAMKKELIIQGLGWGHLPDFLIEEELRTGVLVSLAEERLPGSTEIVAATRRLDRAPGPVAARLWHFLSNSFERSA